jgi:hypothetical protein
MVRSWFMLALLCATGVAAQQQQPQMRPQPFPGPEVQDLFLRWPLPVGAEQYADIDGRRILQDVVALAGIARRFRDEVHPKYWGRIIGLESDQWTADWLAQRFRTVGLSDVRIQPFDLPDQWYPRTFSVVAKSGSETFELVSAQPNFNSPGTPAGGLMGLEAVYVGLGNEADFMGKDVRGKAVFTYSMLGAPNAGAVRRANEKGAAVVFDVTMLPGNLRYQAYPGNTQVPTFTVGNDDGTKLRQMVETATAPVRVDVVLDVIRRPNSKTSLVWGSLPGASDETVFVTAHKDGWFDGSGDNASGVASMIALAEHYAKIPQAQRPRTLVFVGLDGHHNSGNNGSATGIRWMVDNRATIFAKTALMINAEHPSTVQTMIRPRYTNENIAWGNTYMPQQWYAGGPDRPELTRIAMRAFDEFGVTHYIEGQRNGTTPPATDAGSFYRYMPTLVTSEYHHYFHSDLETPETVPWTGLEASTRAYARIIDEVNKLPLSALKRPEQATTNNNQ